MHLSNFPQLIILVILLYSYKTIGLTINTRQNITKTRLDDIIINNNNTSSNTVQISVGNVVTPIPLSPKLVNKIDTIQVQRKKMLDTTTIVISQENNLEWKCPNITRNRNLECGCDMPHTLRCSSDIHGLDTIAGYLRKSKYAVSLLDCTLKNVTYLNDARIFENISLHGLVISSGEIKRVHRLAFLGIKTPLQALGLPNNALANVPYNSFAPLTTLDRLDLSNNHIKTLTSADFMTLKKLTYLELSENQLTTISPRTFIPLKNLITLKLNGNRLGDFPESFEAIGKLINLRALDLKSNSIKGPLTESTLPSLPNLELLNLDRNLLTSVQNSALQGFPFLITLSLRHNQIDVLQDHAFQGLNLLQELDLGYNGIVAVSGASLQHLPHLLVLDLTQNFLRSLSSDLIKPLMSLKELRLDGNDISIVDKNSLDGANELLSLSLQNNPLSCDCTLKPFVEWLLSSKISSHDLLGAICATPPHLEGAPLLEIPVDSLSCDSNDNEYDNVNVMEQYNDNNNNRNNNLSQFHDMTDVMVLRELYMSTDYGLILTWSINMNMNEFTCDAIFVYKEANIHEILLDHSPIHCESQFINGDNIISVILPENSALEIGESYRFCLVLLKEKHNEKEPIIGCSNITKYEINTSSKLVPTQLINNLANDLSSIDKISQHNDELTSFDNDDNNYINDLKIINNNQTKRLSLTNNSDSFLNKLTISKNFLPGLGLGIILTSLIVFIWGATKLKSNRTNTQTVTNGYAGQDQLTTPHHHQHQQDAESRNRYFKLNATTSL